MTFNFENKKNQTQAKAVQPPSEYQAYRARAKAEAERYSNAIEIDMWLCMCFRTPAELADWQAEFGCGGQGERVWSLDVDWSPWRPEKPRRGFGQDNLSPKKLPTPPKDADSLSFEADCLTYLERVRQALLKADTCPTKSKYALETGIYTLIVFPSMQDKKSWVKQMGLAQFGSKYMDGTAVLDVLRRNKT